MSVVSEQILKEYDSGKPFKCSTPSNSKRKESMRFGYEEALISHLMFSEAKQLEENDYNLVLYSKLPEEKLVKLDCLPLAICCLVVNKQIVSLLNEFCPNDFQALPVYVKNDPGVKNITPYCNQDYFLINIVSLVDSVNYEQSQVTRFADLRLEDEILGFKKLVFKQNVMNNHHLAREGNYTGMIIASRELAIYLNKHKIKGMELYPDYDAYTLC